MTQLKKTLHYHLIYMAEWDGQKLTNEFAHLAELLSAERWIHRTARCTKASSTKQSEPLYQAARYSTLSNSDYTRGLVSDRIFATMGL